MKKGCFLSVIISLTFLIIAIFFLIKNYGELFIDFGKDKVLSLAHEKVNDKLNELDNSEYVDSVRILFNNYFDDFNKSDIENELKRIEEVTQNFDIILTDLKIDSTEFSFLKRNLSKHEK